MSKLWVSTGLYTVHVPYSVPYSLILFFLPVIGTSCTCPKITVAPHKLKNLTHRNTFIHESNTMTLPPARRWHHPAGRGTSPPSPWRIIADHNRSLALPLLSPVRQKPAALKAVEINYFSSLKTLTQWGSQSGSSQQAWSQHIVTLISLDMLSSSAQAQSRAARKHVITGASKNAVKTPTSYCAFVH